MVKGCALVVLAATLLGCAARRATWKEPVEWPDEHSAQLVGQPMEQEPRSPRQPLFARW